LLLLFLLLCKTAAGAAIAATIGKATINARMNARLMVGMYPNREAMFARYLTAAGASSNEHLCQTCVLGCM
jgi:hypothetical protein